MWLRIIMLRIWNIGGNQNEGMAENNNFDIDENAITEEHKEIVEKVIQIIQEGKTCDGIVFKKVDSKKLKSQTAKVNAAISHIKTNNITQTNNLIKACSVWIAEEMGLKKFELKEKKVPRWKRRIEGDIKRLRKDVCLLDRKEKNELGRMGPKKSRKLREMEEKYRVRRKGLKTVIEELKQRMIAKSAKIKRYEQRINQFRLNRMFYVDQKKSTQSSTAVELEGLKYQILRIVKGSGVTSGVLRKSTIKVPIG